MRGRLDCDSLLLRAFVAVAEAGSFTRAAERIGRSQPAVTLHITSSGWKSFSANR